MTARPLALLFLTALLCGAAASGRAQDVNMCIDRCFGSYSAEAAQGRTGARDRCLSACRANGASASASYGAIALDRQSGAWGYSDHFANRARAEGAAMQRCQEHGSGCETVVWFDRRCGAVSLAKGHQAYWSLESTEAKARAAAMAKCSAAGGRECRMQVYHCSF